MRISTLAFSLLSLAVCISAASLQPLLAHRVPAISAASIGQDLERRQISIGTQPTVPSQCTSICNPVNNEVSLGCPVTACCTTTFETSYYNCLECVGMALNATNYATAQNDLNLLYTTCVDLGFVLPRMELPGQTASNSSSSAASGAHPMSTGSVAAPSASAAAPFTTASSGVAPSSSATTATGAAVSTKWHGVRPEALIGAAVLLGFVQPW